MPQARKPEKYLRYQGPPEFLCRDYIMFLLSPLFKPIMGFSASIIKIMLPIAPRKKGVILDASLANPDMAKNYIQYPIEDLKIPVLILHLKDDKVAPYKTLEKALYRFPQATLITFETGGHFIVGHENEINQVITKFIVNHA